MKTIIKRTVMSLYVRDLISATSVARAFSRLALHTA